MENMTMSSWIALSIGFLHALEPGHGKTALFTYLASGKKTWIEGLVISLSSAVTHSAAVLLIAFVSHYLLHQNTSEESIHEIAWVLSLLSGGIICGLGVWVILKTQKGEDLHAHCCGHEEHSHDHHHHHDHDHDHKHDAKKVSLLTSGLIGMATGMIPCPTVVVAYLSGVSTGNSYLGVQSVVFFALGMFLALISVIMLFNFGGQKVLEKFKTVKLTSFNWGYVQGGLFIVIGVFTAFIH